MVSVFFYLRVVVMMYMAEPSGQTATSRPSRAAMAALVASTIAIFYLGLLPTRILDLAASFDRDDPLSGLGASVSGLQARELQSARW